MHLAALLLPPAAALLAPAVVPKARRASRSDPKRSHSSTRSPATLEISQAEALYKNMASCACEAAADATSSRSGDVGRRQATPSARSAGRIAHDSFKGRARK